MKPCGKHQRLAEGRATHLRAEPRALGAVRRAEQPSPRQRVVAPVGVVGILELVRHDAD